MRDVWLRLAGGIGALAVGVAAVALVVVLAHRTPGPVAAATPGLPSSTDAASAKAFPKPPDGAVVFARQDGPYALALGVVPATGLLQTSVVDGQGKGARDLHVSYSVHDGSKVVRATAVSCGAGCYDATLPLGKPTRIDVDVAGKDATTVWRVAMPGRWPPPDATALLARAGDAWRRLSTLQFRDRLASDAKHSVETVWRVVAPDRLSYEVEGGPAAVLIGTTRWDKLPGQGWQRSRALRVHQPVPFWSTVANAHIVGQDTLDGKPVWRVTFYDPKDQAWFEVLIEKASLHTLDLRMTTTAHFMHEQYTAFDSPIRIDPPACTGC